jgi:hypothetical protein
MKRIPVLALCIALAVPSFAQAAIKDFTIRSCPVIPAEADGSSYGAAKLVDGKAQTAWCPRAWQDAWFELEFPSPRDVNIFYISNGYQRTTAKGTDLFAANARVKRLELVNDRGEAKIIDLVDGRGEVEYFFSSGDAFTKGVKRIRFTVLGIYPGAKYADALISELRLAFADTSEDEMVKGG